MTGTRLSFVIPAHNEEALIEAALDAILRSIARSTSGNHEEMWLPATPHEVVVVDDSSSDATPEIAKRFAKRNGVRLIQCRGGTCAAARNAGARASSGSVLCFVDADTLVPQNAVQRIIEVHEIEARSVALYRLASREPGTRAWLWWTFWGLARQLPLARAKSMPAFMSCNREFFDIHGPFDETRTIAEEWPLTGAAYRGGKFVYDRTLTAYTSSRRMELRPFGYARTFLKWGCAVLFPWARTLPVAGIRHGADTA